MPVALPPFPTPALCMEPQLSKLPFKGEKVLKSRKIPLIPYVH